MTLGYRIMVVQRVLVPYVWVRLLLPQPSRIMALSSSGFGRRPLKAEIASSNLVRATRIQSVAKAALFFSQPSFLLISLRIGWRLQKSIAFALFVRACRDWITRNAADHSMLDDMSVV